MSQSLGLQSAGQSLIIHAHCYQPPREDPWLEVVEAEPSATPDHDWNARINRECYARLGHAEVRARDPRASSRDPDARSGLARILNLYAWCSFDVGATLCEWLEVHAPNTWHAMLAGDRASVARTGHGNAIAAPYHHVILPLASRRDKVTEVRWGLADFRRRFGRDAEGMWLPECAADEETLDVLAQEGLRFTILAPYQVVGAKGDGLPVLWRGASARTLRIVPYEGNLAGEVAFGGLLQNAPALARRLAPSAGGPRCVTLATDGETFGHHHKNGESVLVEAITIIQANRERSVAITNGAALVAAQSEGDATAVQLVSPSSWSCAHGIERWRSDCGCRLDTSARTSQRWRRPLREAMDALAASCHDVFERDGRGVFRDDPWSVRDAYGSVVALDGAPLVHFAKSIVRDSESSAQIASAQRLLELERAVLRTFTSCAWFFDDVARIETRQVLRYAARALELSGQSARLQDDLLAKLSEAVSNDAQAGTAADLFVREAVPSRAATVRVAAAAAVLARAGSAPSTIASFDVHLANGRDWNALVVTVSHRRTGIGNRYVVQLVGDVPSIEVHVADLNPPFTRAESITLAELPEHEARQLLLGQLRAEHSA